MPNFAAIDIIIGFDDNVPKNVDIRKVAPVAINDKNPAIFLNNNYQFYFFLLFFIGKIIFFI